MTFIAQFNINWVGMWNDELNECHVRNSKDRWMSFLMVPENLNYISTKPPALVEPTYYHDFMTTVR